METRMGTGEEGLEKHLSPSEPFSFPEHGKLYPTITVGSRKRKQPPIPTYTLALILHSQFWLNKPLLLGKMKPMAGSSRVGVYREEALRGLTPLHVTTAWKM